MKSFRARKGPFQEQPYYQLDEIERMCCEELRNVGLFPATPEPIRIDRFIEKRFDVVPQYEELPKGVLGFTEFGKQGVKGVYVSSALEDDTKAGERRIRSTLAHEGGHGLLHGHLFVLEGGQSALFPEGKSAKPRILCRDEQPQEATKSYKGEWWEFQANRAIGALLMPKSLALVAVDQYLTPNGMLGLKTLPAGNRKAAARQLAEIFDVNPIVAEIRLKEMFAKDDVLQPSL
jgi:hypothetical protein